MNLYKYYNKPYELSKYQDRYKIVPDLAYEATRHNKERSPEHEPALARAALERNVTLLFLYVSKLGIEIDTNDSNKALSDLKQIAQEILDGKFNPSNYK
ncbi:MAG: hypothetical protein ACXW2E_00055 [Nitrososphaeraceae archaeon]